MKIFSYLILMSSILILFVCITDIKAEDKSAELTHTQAIASFQAKDYSNLLGMPGFSDTLLNNHFKLYQGYVKNSNTMLTELDTMLDENKEKTSAYAELERRLSWEINGMLLHEYYFENLGGKQSININSAVYKKIIDEFISFERWQKDFISTGMIRGIGWVVLYWEPKTGRLLNTWIDEHNTGNIAGSTPLLVMDVFEHSFITDYQLDRAKYIDAFFKNINWKVVEERFSKLSK